MEMVWLLLSLAGAALIAVAVAKTVRIIPQARARNVERLGRYSRTLRPGIHLTIPFAERVRPVLDRREQVVSLREPVITDDNVILRIDVVLFCKVSEAPEEVYQPGYPGYPPEYKADYRIENYVRAIEKLTGTVLRNVVGAMSLDHALTARDEINRTLLAQVNATTEPDWGITVTRVEIMTIDPPESVKDAMENKQGTILRAQGQAKAIDTVFRAIHAGDPDPKLLAYQYLQVLPQLTQGQGSTVVVIPSELTSALKAVGSMFGGEQPGHPALPAQPAQPAQSAQSAQPAQPEEPGEPAPPESSAA